MSEQVRKRFLDSSGPFLAITKIFISDYETCSMSLIFDPRILGDMKLSIEPAVLQKIAMKRQARNRAVCKSVVCKHWLRGLCKKSDNCEFLHEYDLEKMPPCHFYTTYNECNNPDCPFLHLEPDKLLQDCPWYDRGFCKHGPNCKNRHVRREPCMDYMAGFCPKGPDCKYGHPKFERPTENGWLAPHICSRCQQVGHRANHCTYGQQS